MFFPAAKITEVEKERTLGFLESPGRHDSRGHTHTHTVKSEVCQTA